MGLLIAFAITLFVFFSLRDWSRRRGFAGKCRYCTYFRKHKATGKFFCSASYRGGNLEPDLHGCETYFPDDEKTFRDTDECKQMDPLKCGHSWTCDGKTIYCSKTQCGLLGEFLGKDICPYGKD